MNVQDGVDLPLSGFLPQLAFEIALNLETICLVGASTSTTRRVFHAYGVLRRRQEHKPRQRTANVVLHRHAVQTRPVIFKAAQQGLTGQSTIEAELVAGLHAMKEAIGLLQTALTADARSTSVGVTAVDFIHGCPCCRQDWVILKVRPGKGSSFMLSDAVSTSSASVVD